MNWAVSIAVFVPLVFLLQHILPFLIADAIALAAVFCLFFFYLHKRAIAIECSHCHNLIESNTPWICGNVDRHCRNDQVPLHDHDGKLIGYAGRVVDDSTITEDNPRYRLPPKRERDGKIFEFRKTLFLYNGFRIKAPVDDLIVVEGFTGVWWLTQNGFPSVVAIMGADCSEKQAELIVSLIKPDGRVWLMPDGNQTGNRNEAGKRCAQSLLIQVSRYRLTRWVKLGEDKQPTDLSAEQLKTCFTL